MAFTDWSTSASSNTTVGGVGIAPGMTRSDVDNAIRALMAEAKAGVVEGVSVKTYGAAGNGSADDTASIQSSFDSLTSSGGFIDMPKGTYLLLGDLTFTGTRMRLHGKGEHATLINYNKATAGTALKFARGGVVGNAPGTEQSAITDLALTKSTSGACVGIHLDNVSAGCLIANVAFTGGSWDDDSISLLVQGREFIWIDRCWLYGDRPLVFRHNPYYPSLDADHSNIRRSFIVGESATRPCVEFESGFNFSNVAFRDTAFSKGKDGLLWNDTASTVESFCLTLDNCRFENGLDSAGYCLRLESTVQNLTSLIVKGTKFDAARRGFYLRKVKSVTFDGCMFDNASIIGDITLEAGGRILFTNCRGNGGTLTVTNGRCVYKTAESRTLGFEELWVYDANSSSGAMQTDTPFGGVPFTLGGGTISAATQANPCVITTTAAHGITTGDIVEVANVVGMTQLNGNEYTATRLSDTTLSLNVDSTGFTAYASAGKVGGVRKITDNTFAGFILISTTEDLSCIYNLRGGTQTVAEISGDTGFYSATKDTDAQHNIYWEAAGVITNAYKIQNQRGAAVTYSVLRLGTNVGG